ncbi:MAG: hypothetical protein ACRCY8_02810 [Dermatophilaceae bacterium]
MVALSRKTASQIDHHRRMVLSAPRARAAEPLWRARGIRAEGPR